MSEFIILSYIDVFILIAAFIYGIITVLVKKGATYFKFFVCAVGCYAIADLLRLTYYTCQGEQAGLTGMFTVGYFGCFLFMFSASFKPFDAIVDDRKKEFLKYRIIPITAPAFFLVLTVLSYLPIYNIIPVRGFVTISVMTIPKLASSYFILKHLIFPDDGLGLLKGVRLCNLFALFVLTADSVYTFSAVIENRIFMLISGLVLGLCAIGLMVTAKRGMKQWTA